MANVVGKRYVCKKCGAEVIITRGGKGTIMCCGEPMEIKKQEQKKEEVGK
jgi:desulfoferrodoxin-like iron-binding protein